MLDGESRLLVCGGTTSRGNWCRRLEISSNKWYKVELEQRIEPEEVIKKMKDLKKIAIKFYPFQPVYEVKIDGVVALKIGTFIDLQPLKNVKVWSGRSFYQKPNALIRNLEFSSS